MDSCRCHCGWEERQGNFRSLFWLVFAGFQKALSSEDLLFPREEVPNRKELDPIEHIGNKKRQFSKFCFDIQGAVTFLLTR